MNKKNLTIEETFALAVQNHQNNNFKIAENFYKEILEKNPNHFESIFLLGSLSIQTKNFDKVKKNLDGKKFFYLGKKISQEKYEKTIYCCNYVFVFINDKYICRN